MTNLVWYKYTDLRTLDHLPLINAHANALVNDSKVIHVFCVDDRFFGKTKNYGFTKFDKYKIKFLYQSLIYLYDKIKLNIYFGRPEDIIINLVEKYDIKQIYHYIDILKDETTISNTIEEKLIDKVEWKTFWGNTMFHKDDFDDIFSENFQDFRQLLSNKNIKPIEIVNKYSGIIFEDNDSHKKIQDALLGQHNFETIFNGGENNAWKRLHFYFFETKDLSNYSPGNYSCKISPYLAFGNISAKSIFWELKKYEQILESNFSTYSMWIELLWRDFFKFLLLRKGSKFFSLGGSLCDTCNIVWRQNNDETITMYKKWKDGCTGYPIIDANMMEIKNTGYMSNKGREIVANFLVNVLNIYWRLGAEYFESILIDHDVASNYGNWNLIINNISRKEEAYKNPCIVDPDCKYIKKWLPQLEDENPSDIYNCTLKNYIKLMITIKQKPL